VSIEARERPAGCLPSVVFCISYLFLLFAALLVNHGGDLVVLTPSLLEAAGGSHGLHAALKGAAWS
jgi:hypothetical protein